MSYSEQQLKDAVDAVFQQFDKDNSGTLDSAEVRSLVNAALKQMNANRSATEKEVDALIANVDKNGDGKIGKVELYEIFKQVSKHWFTTTYAYCINLFINLLRPIIKKNATFLGC